MSFLPFSVTKSTRGKPQAHDLEISHLGMWKICLGSSSLKMKQTTLGMVSLLFWKGKGKKYCEKVDIFHLAMINFCVSIYKKQPISTHGFKIYFTFCILYLNSYTIYHVLPNSPHFLIHSTSCSFSGKRKT